MKIKRYVGRTTREAMAKLRAELGADAIVLKNQEVADGVEILAMADAELEVDELPRADRAYRRPDESHRRSDDASQRAAEPRSVDAPMSTVNFEAYVRERQQRRKQALHGDVAGDVPASTATNAPASAQPSSAAPAEGAVHGLAPTHRSVERTDIGRPEPGVNPAAQAPLADAMRSSAIVCADPTTGPASPLASPPATGQPGLRSGSGNLDVGQLMSELRAMRGFLTERIESVSWFEGVRRRPAQSRMLRSLLNAGFSAALARRLADHLPADFGDAEAAQWLAAALRRNVRVEAPGTTVFDAGGTFALLGPTGVGKTTTAAKIAAQFAVRHGAQSVGLITADVYRIGAQDQLRTFGRLLGVPVHVAHDVSMLADLLQLFRNRKLVLIDTAGVGQRDERVGELLAALSSTQVRKIVVLNAAMQAEAIEEVVDAYQARRSAGVVVSKVDEAVQLGGLLDCLIRHRLPLQGIANGQRVPEDWHRPDAGVLVDLALAAARSARSTPFDFDEAELAMLMSACPQGPAATGPTASAKSAAPIGAVGV